MRLFQPKKWCQHCSTEDPETAGSLLISTLDATTKDRLWHYSELTRVSESVASPLKAGIQAIRAKVIPRHSFSHWTIRQATRYNRLLVPFTAVLPWDPSLVVIQMSSVLLTLLSTRSATVSLSQVAKLTIYLKTLLAILFYPLLTVALTFKRSRSGSSICNEHWYTRKF